MPENIDRHHGKTNTHKNKEKEVNCPVEGCDATTLSRGLHLHILRSSGNGHGPQNEIPEDVNLEDAEEVGKREVTMDYPEERNTEQVARLCPYCERPFRGKHGVMIHLGQTAGRKDHPKNPKDKHEPDDFAIVHVDDDENIVEVVEEGTMMPSTKSRRDEEEGPSNEDIRKHIEELREQGLEEEAEKAERMLLKE
jgi:hypothetical protein